MCVSVCKHTHKVAHAAHFNHAAPYGDEGKGLREQVQASVDGRMDKGETERERARFRWMAPQIKGKRVKRIKGRGKTGTWTRAILRED